MDRVVAFVPVVAYSLSLTLNLPEVKGNYDKNYITSKCYYHYTKFGMASDAEGEIRHELFVVVHSHSSSAQIERTLFAAQYLFSLFIPRVAPFVATCSYEE